MKNTLLSIFLSLLTSGFLLAQNNYDLNFQVTTNDKSNGGDYDVLVQIRSATATFQLGTSNIRFNYNDDRLTYSSITASNFNSAPFYQLMTGTGSGSGLISLNLELAFASFGQPDITTSAWVDVATVHFTIDDINEPAHLDFRPFDNLAGNCVMLDDDLVTPLGTGGTPWDNVEWNGSSWSRGNGTNEAPNNTDAGKYIVISSGTASIGDYVECDSLSVVGGATLNLDVSGSDQGHLYVNSNSANVSGTFNINATSDGYAQYIGPAVSATIDQYVGSSAGWRHLGWPVNGDMSTVSGVTVNYGGGALGNSYTFNTSTFAWDAPASSATTPGSDGVSLYIGGANFPVTGSILTWTGTLNNGDQNNTYSYASNPVGDVNFDGWNLVANPYPSNINWESVDASQTDFSSISVWDPSTGAYKTYNNGVGDGNQYVAPGQAVWIKAATGDDGDAINIADTDRAFDGGNIFIGNFKTSQSGSVKNIALNVKDANGFEDNMFVTFRDLSLKAYDAQYDAHKPWNIDPNPNMYSYASTGERLAINSYGNFNSSHIIPVGFSSSQENSTYTISMDMAKVDASWGDVFLYDHFNGTIHNLTQNGDYAFTHSLLAPEGRFQIQFVSSAIGLAEPISSDMKIYSYENTVAISRPNPAGNLQVALYSLTGQKVFEAEFGSERLIEFATSLPKAYYVVKAQDSNGAQQSQKVIVQ